jgi:hypothetical protein
MKRKAQPGNPTSSIGRAQPINDDVNWLNVGLMAMACGAAIVAPFHVFLLAYAVLGPLHYLTEISWLHDRKYFTRRNQARQWWLALVLFSILALALTYAGNDPSNHRATTVFGTALICLVFAGAAAAIYVRDWRKGLGLLLILALGLAFFSSFQAYAWAVLAVTLLTTIVHVFIFTGAFILLGALKSRSRVAVLSLAVFVACAILAVTVTAPFAAPTPRVRQLYLSFELLNRALLLLFGRSQGVYESVGIGVMRLIAFAYLYHYLNWFSKTSIIKWHEVTRSRAVAIFAFWLAGGAIYLYDYRIGLGVFYILSMLHVFLEFPLNHQTLVDIGKSLSRWGSIDSPRGTGERPQLTAISLKD